MDHEQEFEERYASAAAEIESHLNRGWDAGFSRREGCPDALKVRMTQTVDLLSEVLSDHGDKEPGETDVQAVDVAWGALTLQRVEPGLWSRAGLKLDFGDDNDNVDFVLAFFWGMAGPLTREEFFKTLSIADAAE